jgi:flagellar biosynthesis/type III secretory pathway protein FliH
MTAPAAPLQPMAQAAPAAAAPAPAPAGQPRAARVVRGADAKMQPLYPATRLLKGAVMDAERIAAEAKQIKEAALAEAAALRKAAKDESDAVRRQAFEHGAKEAASEFTELLKKLEAEIDALKKRFATDVQRVAFRFAKAILDIEFQARPERVVELVRLVMKPARLYTRVKVLLHPDDVERVKADQARLAKELAFVRELQFAADADLPLHGVRVQTEMGTYDGTIDTQIRRLQQHVLPNSEPFPPETVDLG